MAALAPIPGNMPETPLPAGVARIASFMADFSVEATRPSDADIAALSVLPRGTQVYVSAVPGRPADESVGAALRLRAAGFEPVPHVAVRNFGQRGGARRFPARLHGEADVQARAGTLPAIATNAGRSGARMTRSIPGVFRRRGIRSIGVAGYPDGHPKIGPDELKRALAEKIAAAEATGLAVEIVTQFCFDATHHARFRGAAARLRLRTAGAYRACRTDEPVRAAPLCIALRRARLGAGAGTARGLDPPGLCAGGTGRSHPPRALAEAAPTHVSTHFFSFGGLGATARWARAVADGRIMLEGDSGFRVVAPSP